MSDVVKTNMNSQLVASTPPSQNLVQTLETRKIY